MLLTWVVPPQQRMEGRTPQPPTTTRHAPRFKAGLGQANQAQALHESAWRAFPRSKHRINVPADAHPLLRRIRRETLPSYHVPTAVPNEKATKYASQRSTRTHIPSHNNPNPPDFMSSCARPLRPTTTFTNGKYQINQRQPGRGTKGAARGEARAATLTYSPVPFLWLPLTFHQPSPPRTRARDVTPRSTTPTL